MKRRLNIKLIAILFSAMLVFGIGVHVLHGYQVKRNAAGLIERANRARDEGDLTESVRLRARYLAHFPESGEVAKEAALDAKKNLFDMYQQRKEPSNTEVRTAVTLLENAVRIKAYDGELKREAADFWFQITRWSDAISLLDDLEELAAKDEASIREQGEEPVEFTIEDKLRRIECLRRIGTPAEEERAIEQLAEMLGLDLRSYEFDESIATDKFQADAYFTLAQLLLGSTRMDKATARKTLDQMVNVCKASPDRETQAKAFLNRSRLIRAVVQGDEGIEQRKTDVNEAYQRDSSNLSCIAAMAQIYMEEQRYDTAKEFIRNGMNQAELIHQKSALYNLLTQIHIADGDIEGANEVLAEAIAAVPKDSELLWKKARLVLDEATRLKRESLDPANEANQATLDAQSNKQFAAVEDLFPLMRQAYVADPRIEYLKARIQMQRDNDVRGGIKRLRLIREMVPTSLQYDIDIHLSMGYNATREFDLRLEVIRRLLALQPDNLEIKESYIQTLMAMRRNKDALAYTETLIKQLEAEGKEVTPNLKSYKLDLAMKGGFDDSSREMTQAELDAMRKRVQNAYNDKSIPKLQRDLLALEYFRKVGDTKTVMRLVGNLLKEDPTSYQYHALRLQHAENKDDAFRYFEEMKRSVDLKTWGVALLTTEAKLVTKYDLENAGPRVAAVVEQARQVRNPAQRAAVLYELGTLRLAFLNDQAGGLELLEEASKLAPKRLDILQMLYQHASTQPDGKRLDEIVDRIEAVTGKDDDSYRMVEAGRIIWNLDKGNVPEGQKERELGRARQLVMTARQHRPDFVPLMQMMARIQQAEGEYESAIATLREAHNLKPNDAVVIRSIAQIYDELKRPNEVKNWRAKLPQSARGSADIRSELTALAATGESWSEADKQRALELTEELTKMSSATAADWMLKSRILTVAQQNAAAQDAANRAIDKAPSDPTVWTNMLTILAAQKELDKADAVIGRIKSQVSADQQAVVLGRAYQILGRANEAEASFKQAIQQQPDNMALKRVYAEVLFSLKRTDDGLKVIEQIRKSGDPVRDRQHINWARRSLASVYAQTGSYIGFNKGLALIDENADANGRLAEEDLTLWVALCFSRSEPESWERALIMLEQVEKQRSLNDTERFMRAQLYEKFDDQALWLEAKRIAIAVMSRNKSNQKIADTFVKWLLKHGELDLAKRIATENLDPTSGTRIRVNLHAMAKAGNSKGAAEELKKISPSQVSSSADLVKLRDVAMIAEELGQYDQSFYQMAISGYSQLGKIAPMESLRLADALGKYGSSENVRQALKICREASSVKIANEASSAIALGILRRHPDKWNGELKEAVQQTGQWLTQVADSNPDDLKMRWRLAEFHDMMGNLDIVETEYEKILAAPEFTNEMERGMLMNNLAYAMALNGKTDRPATLVSQAKEYIGPTSDVLDTEGFIHYLRGSNELALVSFKAALKSGPVTPQKYLHYTLALFKKGDKSQARDAWTKAWQAGLNRDKLPQALRDEFDQLASTLGKVDQS